MPRHFWRALACSSWLVAAPALAQTPRLFFSDLISGPNSGGESVSGSSGSYVTLYGNGFGTAQGTSTVTLNGASCLRVVSWGTPWLWYQKIVVQLGATCTSGNFVVTVNGHASNGAPFTVRAGTIYCVSTTGNDHDTGAFPNQCWATVLQAKNTMAAGDITYALDGVSQTTVDNYSAAFAISSGGAEGAPLALVAYPGATVTIGDPSLQLGIRTPNITGTFDHWVFAGLVVRADQALNFGWTDFRVVGNDVSCPGATGYACVQPYADTQWYLGNDIHDTGQACGNNANTCKLYHAVYFGISNHEEFGWNVVDPDPRHTGVAGCRGVQFHTDDNSGVDDYDVHVHDNVIRDSICDGLNLVTVNPDLGPVEVYNNVIYHVGTGPDPAGVGSDYACVYLDANNTPDASVQVYNNTLYDCGSRGDSASGGLQVAIPLDIRNNLIDSLGTTEPYLAGGAGTCPLVQGSNNLFFGDGPSPCAALTASVTSDPLFVDAGVHDFHLQSASSPAANGGMTISTLATDLDGVPRPQEGTFALGAYEYNAGYLPPPPSDGGATPDAGGGTADGGSVSSDGGTPGGGKPASGCGCGQSLSLTLAAIWVVLLALGRTPQRRRA